jgi:hypothetical protein
MVAARRSAVTAAASGPQSAARPRPLLLAAARVRTPARALAVLLLLMHAPAWGKAPPRPDDDDGEPRRAVVESELVSLGRVTDVSARAELPFAPHAAVVPESELLYLSPVAGDPRRELHPYFGAGVAAEEARDWDWELAALYGPRAAGVSSLGGSAYLSKGLGADWANNRPPVVELDGSLNVTRFAFDAASPVGAELLQIDFETSARLRLPRGLELQPRALLFLYDKSLSPRTADDVDALSVLARVGTYAPRGLLGARLRWRATSWLSPLVEADELAYAAGVGSATQLEAGLRLDLGHGLRATLAGGLLHNRLSGVARGLPDDRTVPLVEVEAHVHF